MPMVRRCKYTGCHTLVERPAHFCEKHKQYEAEYAKQREAYSRTYYNKRVRNKDEANKERYQFYRSKTWSSLRKLALERDHYLCQYCLALGVVRPNANIGDHITPAEIAPELRTDLSNIATACRDCDNVKRKLEQEIYGTGQGNTHRNTNLRITVSQWAGLIARKKRDVREGL